MYKTIKYVDCQDKNPDLEWFTDKEYENLGVISYFCESRSWRLSFGEIEHLTSDFVDWKGT